MNLHIHTLAIVVLAFVTGCMNPEAHRLYVEGTEAAGEGNIEACIDLLVKARELMPNNSSFIRNNLALCYYEAGRNSEGWFELRQAVLINPLNKNAEQNFNTKWQCWHGISLSVACTL